MTDPQRLSRSPAHSLAAVLLRAAAEEKPSPAVLTRTAHALAVATGAAAASSTVAVAAKGAGSAARAWGVKHSAVSTATGSGLAGGTGAGTAGSAGLTGVKVGLSAVAKWVAIGALGGAVATSSVQALLTDQETKHAQAVATVETNARVSSPRPRATIAARAAPELVASADSKQPERPIAIEAQRAQAAEPALAEPAKPEAPARTESAFLAAEVGFVDQGRAALQRAAFAEALAQLAPYERLFPHQQLLTEVLFLRMESLNRLGDVERARALAARVLALGVVGRQAAQAREVLGP